jgi:hypothetical protein
MKHSARSPIDTALMFLLAAVGVALSCRWLYIAFFTDYRHHLAPALVCIAVGGLVVSYGLARFQRWAIALAVAVVGVVAIFCLFQVLAALSAGDEMNIGLATTGILGVVVEFVLLRAWRMRPNDADAAQVK